MNLTDTQRSLVALGLRIAAEKYVANAVFLRAPMPGYGVSAHAEDIATIFGQQAKDSRALAKLFEDAEEVTITMHGDDPLRVMREVVAVLTGKGVKATLEYPGFILVGDRAFGTANETWGWSSGYSPKGVEKNECGDMAIPSDSEDVQAIAAAIYKSLTQYVVIWGTGDVEQNRDSFDTLDQVRGMLAHDTDMTPAMIEKFIETGKSDNSEEDPAASTQFDSPWIRLERPVQS